VTVPGRSDVDVVVVPVGPHGVVPLGIGDGRVAERVLEVEVRRVTGVGLAVWAHARQGHTAR